MTEDFKAGVRAALEAIPLPPMPVNPTEFSAGARHAYLAARAGVKALLSAEAEGAPQPGPSARVKEALVKLEAAASEVSRLGATPGPHWPPLRTALITAKAALNAISPTFAPASWKDACRVKNGSDICEEPCARCADPAAGPAPLPVAWKILLSGLPSYLTESKLDAELAAKVEGVIVVPLYMHPAPAPYAVAETGYPEFKRDVLATITNAVGISFRPGVQAGKAAAVKRAIFDLLEAHPAGTPMAACPNRGEGRTYEDGVRAAAMRGYLSADVNNRHAVERAILGLLEGGA